MRVPRVVLEQEGVVFDEDGRAYLAQRLSMDELHALLGWFDPEDTSRTEWLSSATNAGHAWVRPVACQFVDGRPRRVCDRDGRCW
jgi:hypothetical protein